MSKNYELTNELKALFPEYVARWSAACLKTMEPNDGFDTAYAVASTKELYRVAGLAIPTHFFIGTWPECIAEARRVQTAVEQTIKPGAPAVVDVSAALSWGQMSAAAAAFARFFVDEMGVEELREKADCITNITRSSGPTLLFAEAAFLSYHPTEIVEDPDNKEQLQCRWGQPTGLNGWVEGSVDDLIAGCVAAKKSGGTKKGRK